MTTTVTTTATSAAAIAVVSASAAAYLLVPARRRLPTAGSSPPWRLRLPSLSPALDHPWLSAAAVAGLLAPVGAAPGIAAGVLVRALVPVLRDAAAGRRTAAERAGWQAALVAVAAGLRAAAPLPAALRRGASGAAGVGAADVARCLSRVAAAVDMGAEPRAALLARCPDGPGRSLAAVLGLAHDVGAAPGELVSRLADLVAAHAAAERTTAVALSSARSTVHVLAALPLAGVALAAAFGASAPAYLLTTTVGHASLLAGACFEAAGIGWTRRLVAGAVP